MTVFSYMCLLLHYNVDLQFYIFPSLIVGPSIRVKYHHIIVFLARILSFFLFFLLSFLRKICQIYLQGSFLNLLSSSN